jgi:NADH dehydrogenase FAD-containing subunit
MQSIGKKGFLDMCTATMKVTEQLMTGVNAIEGLEVLGEPDMTVFAYHSTNSKVNIFAVGDQMEARGWNINRQQKPNALHAMVTINHEQAIDQYLQDLQDSYSHVAANPDLAYEGSAAMYGMVSAVPLKGVIEKNVLDMMESSYTPGADSLELGKEDGDKNLAMLLGTGFVKIADKVKNVLR